MPLTLPAPIAAYLTAEKARDADAAAACFLDAAVVKDDGHTHRGRDEIRQWIADYLVKYSFTATPFNIREEDGQVEVAIHLEGNFPGSPIDLRYVFVLRDGSIAALDIGV